MYIKQIYTSCMSQASYYIESKEECVIIDPLRDIKIYEDIISKRGKKLKYVLETHFHADFVSGHIDLANKFNSKIVFGPNSNPSYDVLIVKDNEILKIGDIDIMVLHTPGHTMESVCYLLIDKNNVNHCLFTGDTLFVGDVGRPDLASNSTISIDTMAGLLYDSIYNKILKLPDHTIIYPAHGKGTQCGKNLSSKNHSTIGEQRLFNYALKFKNKNDFINSIITDIPPAPDYFKESVIKNSKGYNNIELLLKKSLSPYNLIDFITASDNNCIIIDTRKSSDFAKGHIKNSINIGLNGRYAISAANILTVKSKILIICDKGFEKESVVRLFRVGFENIIGFLKGGFNTWKNSGKPIENIKRISSNEILNFNNHKILDVRNVIEYKNGNIDNSINIPLFKINDHLNELNKSDKYLIHCETGYRSMIATSLLKKNGFKNLIDIGDGYLGFIKNNNVEILN